MEAIVTNELHFSKLDKPIVRVEAYTPLRVPCPTEEELARVPARFKCFVCLRYRGRKKFGGFVANEKVCRLCYPFVDERDIEPPPNHIVATKRSRTTVPTVVDVWAGLEEELEED